MKRTLALLICAVAVGVYGCGNDDNKGGTNNGGTNNGGTNNGGTNNGTPNNTTGTNNDTTGTNNDTTGTNNDTTGTNNDTTGTNNGTTGTNNDTNSGAINVSVTYGPTSGPVGSTVMATFTLTNFSFNEDAIGMANVEGEGHYHVYLDTEDPANELLVSGANPGTIPIALDGVEITEGAHMLVFSVHKNDHTEFTNPIEFSVPFTVTAP